MAITDCDDKLLLLIKKKKIAYHVTKSAVVLRHLNLADVSRRAEVRSDGGTHKKRGIVSTNYTYQAYCILNIDRRSIDGIKIQSILIIT